MRFIHTSDWHLGRLFHGKHLTEDQAYVLEDFHRAVKEYRPDAILIAGDLYDRAVPPTEAVELLDDTLAKLILQAKVPVVMIAGNHDSPQRVNFGSRLLAQQGLYVVGTLTQQTKPIVLSDKEGDVYFMPFTYAEPSLVRNVFKRTELDSHESAMQFLVQQSLTQMPRNARKVAIVHAFIAGSSESESERPLSVGGSSNIASKVFNAFNYTALGHLHNAQTAGAEQIRYAGSLLKYSFDEANHKKGIYIVDMDKAGAIELEKVALRTRHDVKVVEGYFDDILANRIKYPYTEDYVSVKLLDQVPILDVHGQLETIYSNLMQIERPNLVVEGKLQKPEGDHRQLSERALFDSFFKQMTGTEMTAEESQVFGESLDELMQQEREVTK